MLYVATGFLHIQKQHAHLSPLLFLVFPGDIIFFTSFTSILDCIKQLNWKNNLFD